MWFLALLRLASLWFTVCTRGVVEYRVLAVASGRLVSPDANKGEGAFWPYVSDIYTHTLFLPILVALAVCISLIKHEMHLFLQLLLRVGGVGWGGRGATSGLRPAADGPRVYL